MTTANPHDLLDWLLALPEPARRAELGQLSPAERREFSHHWRLWARPEQLPPAGEWRQWLVLAGRGFGKTRAGAEWVRAIAERAPDARIALVGASLGEARAVMVEGESGLLAISPAARRPQFEPTRRRLRWPNGAEATLFSASDPDGLRGAQHSQAWCDEIAKWENAGERAEQCWNNMLLGLRLGDSPQAVATTTPRAVPLVMRLVADPATVVTRGASEDNIAHLPKHFLRDMRRQFGRSALARQELDGELIAEREGALWSRACLERARTGRSPAPDEITRCVVGVDPPASAHGDACGIVVVALGPDDIAHVLADASVTRPSPERWARAVAAAAAAWRADRVIAEANQGGAMVASVLRAADINLPVRLVHASRGKVARAEPVAALYEAGRVRHAGQFPRLEDEMCGMAAGGAYAGPGRSPDRADALVWALSELLLGRRTAGPRVRVG